MSIQYHQLTAMSPREALGAEAEEDKAEAAGKGKDAEEDKAKAVDKGKAAEEDKEKTVDSAETVVRVGVLGNWEIG